MAGLGREALHSQLASGLRVAVHLVRARGSGRRRVAELSVLRRAADGLVHAEPGWTWDGSADSGSPGPGASLLDELLRA